MSYLIDIAAFIGLLIFCAGLWMIYKPLAPIAFGLAVMLFCYRLSRINVKVHKQ